MLRSILTTCRSAPTTPCYSSESSAWRSEKGGGGEGVLQRVVHSGFKASSHCPLSDSSPRAHDPFQPDQLQPFYVALVLHTRHFLEHFGKDERLFFLAFRSWGGFHFYVPRVGYRPVTLKSRLLETSHLYFSCIP